ncbi:hypothetical protein PGT21_001570 [Puccinia graminis f. sp. tritici]|uniref:Uncharacterized protein n=1 Tax=Puccinia graminis f. sp. tritici TaxID=56615 RepID=A0A5B0NDA1_PUCGR|nr:hypothetical protein PGT21_001570 [Puccinia graminis f. sp. tritici]
MDLQPCSVSIHAGKCWPWVSAYAYTAFHLLHSRPLSPFFRLNTCIYYFNHRTLRPIFPRSALSLLTHPGRWLSTKCIFIPPAGDQPEPHRTVPSPLRNVLHQFPPCLVPVTPSVSPSPARSPSSVSSVVCNISIPL